MDGWMDDKGNASWGMHIFYLLCLLSSASSSVATTNLVDWLRMADSRGEERVELTLSSSCILLRSEPSLFGLEISRRAASCRRGRARRRAARARRWRAAAPAWSRAARTAIFRACRRRARAIQSRGWPRRTARPSWCTRRRRRWRSRPPSWRPHRPASQPVGNQQFRRRPAMRGYQY